MVLAELTAQLNWLHKNPLALWGPWRQEGEERERSNGIINNNNFFGKFITHAASAAEVIGFDERIYLLDLRRWLRGRFFRRNLLFGLVTWSFQDYLYLESFFHPDYKSWFIGTHSVHIAGEGWETKVADAALLIWIMKVQAKPVLPVVYEGIEAVTGPGLLLCLLPCLCQSMRQACVRLSRMAMLTCCFTYSLVGHVLAVRLSGPEFNGQIRTEGERLWLGGWNNEVIGLEAFVSL